MVIIALSLLVILLYTRARNQRLRNEATVRDLHTELRRLESSLQTTTLQLSKEKAEEQQKYLQLKHRISLSLIERFSWVNKLGDIYIDADMSLNKSWESIFSRIKKELHVSAGRNLAKEIEHTICEQQPQLWIEFESLGLIPSERTMLLFLISGISTRVIRELTGKTEASIYNMKTRIKNKLRQSDSPFALCVIEKL